MDLKAVEAVPWMLRKLASSGHDIIYDRIAEALPELGAHVLEPALSVLAEVAKDQEARHSICEVLGKLRVKDDRILAALLRVYEDDPEYEAMLLADYGDAQILPRLQQDIEALIPDFDNRASRDSLPLSDHFVDHLGGELPPELQTRVDGWVAQWEARREPPPKLVVASSGPKVGRNDPCPCGSGKKYKKCCLDKPLSGSAL